MNIFMLVSPLLCACGVVLFVGFFTTSQHQNATNISVLVGLIRDKNSCKVSKWIKEGLKHDILSFFPSNPTQELGNPTWESLGHLDH